MSETTNVLDFFTLHHRDGSLAGLICLHVVNMLGTGGQVHRDEMKELYMWKTLLCEISVSMASFKICRRSKSGENMDDLISVSESREFCGANGSLQWVTKEFLKTFHFTLKLLRRRQGQGQSRVRDLTKTNDLVGGIKQLQHFALAFSCVTLGVEVTDASIGGVDMSGRPTEVGSETAKVYSQAGFGFFLGEKSMVDGSRGRFNLLQRLEKDHSILSSIQAVETRRLGMLIDWPQFHVDLFRAILESQDPRASGIAMKHIANAKM